MERAVTRVFGAALWVLRVVGVVGVVACLQLTAACGSDEPADDEHNHGEHEHDNEHDHTKPVGKPSGADCPDGSTLTYESFGQKFMSDYCLRCHSSSVKGADRKGAPADHNFDSLAEIEILIDHIDQKAASGPESTNTSMPTGDPKPSMELREQLGEWLACGAP
jgi:cytochrome c5